MSQMVTDQYYWTKDIRRNWLKFGRKWGQNYNTYRTTSNKINMALVIWHYSIFWSHRAHTISQLFILNITRTSHFYRKSVKVSITWARLRISTVRIKQQNGLSWHPALPQYKSKANNDSVLLKIHFIIFVLTPFNIF